MNVLDPTDNPAPPSMPARRPPRPWKFVGTSLWGLLIFAAMFLGQFAVVIWLVLRQPGPFELSSLPDLVSGGVTISASVITGLPAVLLAIWVATRLSGVPFADYLGLRWTSWKNALAGLLALIVLVTGWDLVSRALGREVTAGFMVEVLKSAQADNALWLLIVAFCIAAPVTEEFFARGFLYRGWSETFLRPTGAIVLSSLVWTAMHLQYDWFFFAEIMSIGLLFGYLRYRTGSTWLTVVLHGLNNLAATIQTMWLASHH
jgi:membrane protease YdiL (CAAX protease family)